VVALGEDRAGESPEAVAAVAQMPMERVMAFAGADTSLDVSWAQRALHLNLQLAESGTVAAEGRTQPVVDRNGELLTRLCHRQDELGSVLAQTDEPRLAH
jgi:hypothetical protein